MREAPIANTRAIVEFENLIRGISADIAMLDNARRVHVCRNFRSIEDVAVGSRRVVLADPA
jgi:hypothetical protein